MSKVFLYVGTYTRPAPYLGTTNGKGIDVFSFDTTTGALTHLGTTENIDNPSYLALDHKGRWLYATSEVWLWGEGTLSAYRIDRETGALTYINKQPTLGSINAYCSVDHANRYAFVANYWDGKMGVVFPIREDGGLDPAISSVEHHGSGPVAARQERAHAHCMLPSPDNRFVVIADLGIDKLMVYKLGEGGQLIPNDPPGVSLAPGAGPRHVVFHPSGRFAYVIQELSSTISALAYDATRGVFEVLQTVSALPVGDEHSHCAHLEISPDGKFVYGSNRGHDSIAIYAVDTNTGRLTYVAHQVTNGKTPRNFAIDPTGSFLLAANQDSDTIVTFRINRETGTLEETGIVTSTPTPVCLKFLAV